MFSDSISKEVRGSANEIICIYDICMYISQGFVLFITLRFCFEKLEQGTPNGLAPPIYHVIQDRTPRGTATAGPGWTCWGQKTGCLGYIA